MTASRKLFIAAVLLAAGFGVARLMGSPAARLYAPSASEEAAATHIAAANRQSQSKSSAPAQPNTARLVPDFAAENPYQLKTPSSAAAGSPPLLPNDMNGIAAIRSPMNAATRSDESPYAVYTPRARLRNEAPRPMDFSDRPPLVDAAAMPTQYPRTDAAVEPASATTAGPNATLREVRPENWQANAAAPGGSNVASVSPPTITASYSPPVEPSLGPVLITAPPWPAPSLLTDDDAGPRKHVVIDGDSLEKLAGRYLDDPQRGNEIFEANRELLASPDLLPIGAELVIPDRANSAAPDLLKQQSSTSENVAIRSASHNMVPIRPIPPAATVMPRAQLLPPRAVE